jgi:hypothetical protein
VLIEPRERGVVALWLQLPCNDCLVVGSDSEAWTVLWASAGVETPCDFDAGADLGAAIRQLRGRAIQLTAVAA